jgi:integrase
MQQLTTKSAAITTTTADKDIYDENDKLYKNFIYSIKTQITRKNYLHFLKYYIKFLGVKSLRELVEGKSQKIIESDIKEYLVYLRNKKKLSYESAKIYLVAIRKFYYVNSDYQFKWDLITSYLGNDDTEDDDNDNYNFDENNNENNNNNNNYEQEEDRPYTKQEIQTMFDASQDIRVKIIISLLSSSGLRHGALPNLKLRDLEKIEKYNIYKVTAYRKSKKFKYYTFCSVECSLLIDTYLSYRKNQGEQLKDNSPLIREQFNTNDKLKVNNPRHITSITLRYLINEVLTKYTNLRKKLPFDYENNRKEGRNPTMLTHGFRKFFNTECVNAGVYPDFIELMLGHKLQGVRSHYFKPDINTLLEGTKECKGYVAAIDSLTINEENRLQKKVQELKEKEDFQTYVIEKQMKEKDEQIKAMMEQLEKVNKHLLNVNVKLENSAETINQANKKIKQLETVVEFTNNNYSLIDK